MVSIPDDLRSFLTDPANRLLNMGPGGEISQVHLWAPDELSETVFTVVGRTADEMYEFGGIGLTKSVPNYRPHGIMVWFPTLRHYGSWDCDHHAIMVFPGVRWTDIMLRPKTYFNAQWYPASIKHRYLRPQDGIRRNPRPDPLADHPRLPGF